MNSNRVSPERALAAILLWQASSQRSINNVEAKDELGLSELELRSVNTISDDLLSADPLTEFSCPGCGSEVRVAFGAKSAYCPPCRKMWHAGDYPEVSFSLDRRLAVAELKRRFRRGMEGVVVTMREQRGALPMVGEFRGMEIGVEVLAKTAGLRDYFSLRGSFRTPETSLSIIIAPSFEDLLLHYTRDSAEALLLTAEDLLIGKLDFHTLVPEMHDRVVSAARVAKYLGANFEELDIADDIGNRMNELLTTLAPLSVQLGKGSESAIGNRFQRNVCIVLSLFTPLPARPIGGKNQDDAVVRLFYKTNRKPRYYPLGVKSFKGDLKTARYFPLKKATDQLKKYARAYLQDDILEVADVPAYVLVAHDFNMQNPETLAEIDAFVGDVGIPLKLLPVKTILEMAQEYTRLAIDRVPKEYVEAFLSGKNAYLGSEDAKAFIQKLDRFDSEERRSPVIDKVRRRLAAKHS